MYFDFRCNACQHVFEDFVKPDVNPSCPKCSGMTMRLLSGGRPVINIDSDAWVKMNRQKTAIDKKFHKEHGTDKLHHSYGS